MFSYFDKLRQAPLEERRRAATTYTVIFVLIVAIVWLVSLGFRFDIFSTSDESENTTNQATNSGIEAPYSE